MTDQPVEPEQNPPGRPIGWRKGNALRAKLPAMRITDELNTWLEQEAAITGCSVADTVRIILTDEMKKRKKSRR